MTLAGFFIFSSLMRLCAPDIDSIILLSFLVEPSAGMTFPVPPIFFSLSFLPVSGGTAHVKGLHSSAKQPFPFFSFFLGFPLCAPRHLSLFFSKILPFFFFSGRGWEKSLSIRVQCLSTVAPSTLVVLPPPFPT